MMASIQSYVRQGRHTFKKWLLNPQVFLMLRSSAYFLAGFGLSAASLAHCALPIAAGFVAATTSWSSLLAAMGSCCGYLLFWGTAGQQGLLWVMGALCGSLLFGNRRLQWNTPVFMPLVAALIAASSGVIFQVWLLDTTPVPIYLLRVGLAAGCTWLFLCVLRGRNPIIDWLTCCVAVLALAQLAPIPWLNLGVAAGAALCVTGAFPMAALAGLALDLAQITPVPMTAVFTCCYLTRFLPRFPRWLPLLTPACIYLAVMGLCGHWDMMMLPALVAGGIVADLLPAPTKLAHRRGETGSAQVRLEMVAGVLAQTQQLLLEVPMLPVDECALVSRAAERACGSCPCRKTCKEAKRILQLPAAILHKPLLSVEELPIVCRKSGRFLAELHRSQEQLRSIRADRERQREYRSAVIQQYQFLSSYLQSLSDQLAKRAEPATPLYEPVVEVFGNREESYNGDCCLKFPGTGCSYYVLLCDGMGTGLGAAQEAKSAAALLRRLLSSGYPAEYALRTLNSICALRERAGAATIDLAQLQLDTGKVTLYKWGAMPSYVISRNHAEKVGVSGPPPGLSVTDCQEMTERLSLRRSEMLVMVSDGIGEEDALRCCLRLGDTKPEDLACALLQCAQSSGEDDATVVTVRLESNIPPRQ